MTALTEIAAERDRQEALFANGSLVWIASHPDCPPDLRLAALVEEVGEVARAYHDRKDLRTELVQVAAVAAAWLDGLQAAEPHDGEDAQARKALKQDKAALLARAEAAEERLEAIRRAAGYETEDEDLRLGEVRQIVRASRSNTERGRASDERAVASDAR